MGRYQTRKHKSSWWTTRALTLPGSNYIGPLNPLDGKPALNEVDYAAYLHDVDPRFRYFQHNTADEDFIARVRRAKGPKWQKALSLGYHSFKKRFFPHTEDVSGYSPLQEEKNPDNSVIYTNNMGYGRQTSSRTPRRITRRTRRIARVASRRLGRRMKKINDGVMFEQEYSSLYEADNCMYIGHTNMNHGRVLTVMMMALVKAGFAKMNVHIDNWTKEFDVHVYGNGPLNILLPYYSGKTTGSSSAETLEEDQIQSSLIFAITNPISFIDIVGGLVTLIRGLDKARKYDFTKFFIRRNGNAGNNEVLCMIDLRSAHFTLSCSSLLKCQNQTVAYATGNTEDPFIKDNIRNNPLEVTRYDNYGYNGFTYKYKSLNGVKTVFACDTNNAIFGTEIDDPDANSQFSKPLSPQAFNLSHKKHKSVWQPGDVHKSYLKDKVVLTFNAFLNKIRRIFDNISYPGPLDVNGNPTVTFVNENTFVKPAVFKLGSSRMFGLEHQIKIFGDPPLRVAFQVDNKYYCKMSYSNRGYTERLVAVTNSEGQSV